MGGTEYLEPDFLGQKGMPFLRLLVDTAKYFRNVVPLYNPNTKVRRTQSLIFSFWVLMNNPRDF